MVEEEDASIPIATKVYKEHHHSAELMEEVEDASSRIVKEQPRAIQSIVGSMVCNWQHKNKEDTKVNTLILVDEWVIINCLTK